MSYGDESSGGGGSGTKLYVGNLSFDTTEEDLRGAFQEYGKIENATVITDRESGRSRGFAFVEYENARDAEDAVKALDSSELGGRNIKVNVARDKRDGNGGGDRGGKRGGGRFGGGGGFRDGGGRGGGRGFRGGGGRGGGRGGGGDKGDKLKIRFVENVTIPDRAVVTPGQTLIKTWRVENNGNTDFPEGTKLIFLRGDRSISTEEEFPVTGCKVGQSVEISAVIMTPTKPGRHTAVFRLADGERIPFGPRLWCDFVVPDLLGGSSSTTQPIPSAPSSEGDSKTSADVQMTSTEPKKAPVEVKAPTAPTTTAPTPAPKVEEPIYRGKYEIQMKALFSMGFKNEELNLYLLENHNGNVQKVCEYLLQSLR